LVALLLYGSGLRVREAFPLRVKDIDFDRRRITVRAGKGDKDRVTMLPESAIPELEAQFLVAKACARKWRFCTFPACIGMGSVTRVLLVRAGDGPKDAAVAELGWTVSGPSPDTCSFAPV
jgi:integrase